MKIGPVLSIFWEKIGPNVIYLALKNAMLSIFGPLNRPFVIYFLGKNRPCYLFWVLSIIKKCVFMMHYVAHHVAHYVVHHMAHHVHGSMSSKYNNR